MKIDDQTVERVASLAGLALDSPEADGLRGELARILDYVERLEAVDIADVAPTSHVTVAQTPLREDVAEPGLRRDDALRNAPEQAEGHVVVPKVL